MVETEARQLSEREERVLSSYVDGECSFLDRYMAHRLIRRNPLAQKFVIQLKSGADAYRAACAHHETADLWDRISNRIDSEERAALYLGKREPLTTIATGSILPEWLSRHALLGGFSGAAIAAIVLVLVTRPLKPGEILPVYSGGPVAAQNSPFQQASLDAHPSAQGTSSMEVDWMRSRGSLRLIPHPSGKSAIIWVKRRELVGSRHGMYLRPTPTIRALVEGGIHVAPLGASK